MHKEEKEECPFCPMEEPEAFTTHPGSANNSTKLADIMATPSKLGDGARPKNGKPKRQSADSKQPKPNPIYSSPDYGDYSCEAHHSISGNQAMKNHKVERWILASKGLIKKDTGYSINNAANGVWLPSTPDKHIKGGGGKLWGSLDKSDTANMAFEVMKAGKGQFHKGHHSIPDREDPSSEKYDAMLKTQLTKIDKTIRGWAGSCFLCEDIDPETGPYNPPWKVHNFFDQLSNNATAHLKSGGSGWKFFISRQAMNHHKSLKKCEERRFSWRTMNF